MKIATANRFAHVVGGIETYLAAVLPALAARGHEVRVWHEFQRPVGATAMVQPPIRTDWMGSDHGPAIEAMSAWRPDVVFLHGVSDADMETRLGRLAPTVVLLHAYHGTCISGSKMFSWPRPQACTRALGPGCLAHYFPRRCGGLNPLTMLSSYGQQRRRQSLLRTCDAVVTLSEHMRQECITQGVAPERVQRLPAFAQVTPPARPPESRPFDQPVRILYLGRMEALKGGHILLQALEQLDPAIRRQVVVTFAGDGRERAAWEARAATLAGDCDIRFTGWLSPGERAEMLHASDLLVVPSLWPEPYGLVGPEAGAAGVPTLGFDVGGIREWLTDSVHGRLVAAGADPVRSLTVALADCLSDRTRLARWGAQAYADSRSRSLVAHVDALERVLESAAHGGARLPVPVSCEAAAARA